MVFQDEDRLMRLEPDRLLVIISDADRRLELLPERHPAMLRLDSPLSPVHQGIGVHELISRSIRRAEHAYSELDEQLSAFRMVIIQSTIGRPEFFDWTGDR